MGRRWSNLITIKMKKTMKRSLYFAAALAIVGAVSCNKELVDNSTPEVPEAKLATLTATIGEPGTKTSLATPENAHVDGSKTFWCAADAISVFDGKSNVEYTIKDSESYEAAEEAVFEGEELDAEAAEFFALYPYTETAEVADGVVKGAVLPAEQTAVEGNLPEGAALAVAYSTDKSALYFKNVATTIGFTLTEAATKVEFVAKGGESIAGTIDITYDGENAPTYTVQAEKGNNTVTLTNLAAGTYFFTILPDVTLSQGYELYIDDVLAKSNISELTLLRSKVYSLGEVVKPIPTAFVYLKPLNNWLLDDARFAAYTWVEDGDDAWYDMIDSNEDGVFEVEVPTTVDGLIFCRMNPAFYENGWNAGNEDNDADKKVWGQSDDLVMPSDDNIAYVLYDSAWNTLDYAVSFEEPVIIPDVTVYVLPSEDWVTNAKAIAAYVWDANGNDWYEATDPDTDGIYEVSVPETYKNIIFVAQTAAFVGGWDNKYAQTSDLTIPTTSSNTFVVYEAEWNTLEYAQSFEEPEEPEEPSMLYLKPNSNWTMSNARFAAYFYGNGETWVSMIDSDSDGIYEVEVPAGYSSVIFCRMNPDTTANIWDNKWDQTIDLTIPTDGKNLYTVKDDTWSKGGGTWSSK